MFRNLMYLAVSLFLFASCSKNEVIRLTVASEEADCVGVGPQKCLLVKKEGQKDWENLYNGIDGFIFEDGNEYVLEVREEKIDNPPADAPSVKYVLVNEISKTAKTSEGLPAKVETPVTQTFRITVASQQADCTGVAPQKCFLIKKDGQKDWEFLYSGIEGFTYEAGNEYVLEVKEEKIDNPPADGSSVKCILVKEISKIKKISENLPKRTK
ncbi:DUF4377 domain-containing protein [Flavobacterium supellecticarium]|uniref:DUF4377 domain-containing protein n=1 Tax=Flavobacterium supellecticarium TaxID=2565924 RepID=UPI001E3E4050|nr:DUF4377 domain-containing protein [Flavobacterium supellecticarium]